VSCGLADRLSPKELGELGLIDLRHRKLRSNRPWLPLLAAENKLVLSAFQAATDVVLGDGRSASFWLDRWMPDGCSVRDVAPAY
jgi:hypothetical protein